MITSRRGQVPSHSVQRLRHVQTWLNWVDSHLLSAVREGNLGGLSQLREHEGLGYLKLLSILLPLHLFLPALESASHIDDTRVAGLGDPPCALAAPGGG